jgi:hypothetical protein
VLSGKSEGGKWLKRVIKIMKITSQCQLDAYNGLKLHAIKVEVSEKLSPGYSWDKENLELPHLITKHLETRKIIYMGNGLSLSKDRGSSGQS